MYVWNGLGARLRVPSPLLAHLAGEFADGLAEVWPLPHAEFLTAEGSRRHLACIALTEGRPLAPVAVTLTEAPLKKAIRTVLPDAPTGLVRALSRLGETAWSADDYRLLLALLREPEAAKVLRHAGCIDAGLVRALAVVPRPLLRAGLCRLSLTGEQISLVAAAYDAVVRRDGPGAGRLLALRWGGAGSAQALFDDVRDDLLPELPAPPVAATDRLRPLGTKAAMRDAAARYANCLKGQVRYAAEGEYAYYEWLGQPGAVIELFHDALNGWMLSEAKLANNETVPAPLRSEIVAELRAAGVAVGRSFNDFDCAAASAARPNFVFESEEVALGWRFGD
jgi:hypothetical protein